MSSACWDIRGANLNQPLNLIIRRTGQRIILFHVLYNSQVIPHLEYCLQAWRPYLQKYINNIEGVQPRMSKMMREVEDEEYEQRMKKNEADVLRYDTP